MKNNAKYSLILLLLLLGSILFLSSLEYNDLRTNYVLVDYEVVNDNTNILDVLLNDDYAEQDNVSIKKPSVPQNRSVKIDTITNNSNILDETQNVFKIQSVTNKVTDCITNGGLAGETGLKTWCWKDIILPSYSENTGVRFSSKELSFATECDEESVFIEGDQLVFDINPTTPPTEGWCTRDFNMRAEIRTAPWPIQHVLGTEEWFGWSYTFGDDYVEDTASEWLFHQVHNGITGQTPLYELMVASTGLYDATAGEIIVKNNVIADAVLTGVIPVAGQTIYVVVHVIWEDDANGLLQIWLDDVNVYDKQVRTVRSGWNYGGNAKWGIYKWTWADAAGVNASAEVGVNHLATSMGALKILTRRPKDLDYGKDSYDIVVPR